MMRLLDSEADRNQQTDLRLALIMLAMFSYLQCVACVGHGVGGTG